MKKVDIERLISKGLIATTVLLLIILGMWMIRNGYEENLSYALYMPLTTNICSATLLFAALAFVLIGFKKNHKYFEVSAWLGGMSVLVMLLKIHEEAITLGRIVFGKNIDIFDIGYVAIPVAIAGIWIYTICRVLQK